MSDAWKNLGVPPTPVADNAIPHDARQVTETEIGQAFRIIAAKHEQQQADRTAQEREAARLQAERRSAEERAYLSWRSARSRAQSELLRRVISWSVIGLVGGVALGVVVGLLTSEAA